MNLNPISPASAKGLAAEGATLIDVREPHEFAAQHIPGSRNVPLSTLGSARLDIPGNMVIFLCKSGMRTASNDAALARLAGPGARVMQGGLMGWASAGLPIEEATPSRKGLFGMFG